MKCEMESCRKKAKLHICFSYGESYRFCFKHSWGFIKQNMARAADTHVGIFIQGVHEAPPKREIDSEARQWVTTPEDRSTTSVKGRVPDRERQSGEDHAWNW